jgi:hypothetical protein
MRSDPSTAPFTVTDDGLVAKLRFDEAHRPAVEELVAEIVEWRLVRYIDSLAPGGTAPGGVARLKVARNTSDRPILFLRREQNPPLPRGEVEVLIDGQTYVAHFVKVACNVLTRAGETRNLLPEVLSRWFGDQAGVSGTEHIVECVLGEDAPVLRPIHP